MGQRGAKKIFLAGCFAAPREALRGRARQEAGGSLATKDTKSTEASTTEYTENTEEF